MKKKCFFENHLLKTGHRQFWKRKITADKQVLFHFEIDRPAKGGQKRKNYIKIITYVFLKECFIMNYAKKAAENYIFFIRPNFFILLHKVVRGILRMLLVRLVL